MLHVGDWLVLYGECVVETGCGESVFFFFFNDTATTEIYTLSLHDALPISTSQFFINLKHNSFLDNGARDYGYAVFGKVVKGMEIGRAHV